MKKLMLSACLLASLNAAAVSATGTNTALYAVFNPAQNTTTIPRVLVNKSFPDYP